MSTEHERTGLFFWKSKTKHSPDSVEGIAQPEINPLVKLDLASPAHDRLITATDLLAQRVGATGAHGFDLKDGEERKLFADDLAYFFSRGILKSPKVPFGYTGSVREGVRTTLVELYPSQDIPFKGNADDITFREYQRALAHAARSTVTTICLEAEKYGKLNKLLHKLIAVTEDSIHYSDLNNGKLDIGFTPSLLAETSILQSQRADIQHKRIPYTTSQAEAAFQQQMNSDTRN